MSQHGESFKVDQRAGLEASVYIRRSMMGTVEASDCSGSSEGQKVGVETREVKKGGMGK